MRKRVEFRLSMPGVGSWNGRWSGERRDYRIVRRLSAEELARVGVTDDKPASFYHSWGDGWAASVSARIMPPGERVKKSDGFCGYDWMVDNIVRWGTAKCQCEWVDAPSFRSASDAHDWERCIHCDCHRAKAECADMERAGQLTLTEE